MAINQISNRMVWKRMEQQNKVMEGEILRREERHRVIEKIRKMSQS